MGYNVEELAEIKPLPSNVIPAKVFRQAQDREVIERPESSKINAFWMPDQVRHDDFEY